MKRQNALEAEMVLAVAAALNRKAVMLCSCIYITLPVIRIGGGERRQPEPY